MENTLKPSPLKKRDRAYYRQRQKNRVFTELVRFFAEEADRRNITKKELAAILEKDPAQITRWLSAPSNFELDTLSDILLALGAEIDHRIVRFEDRALPNDVHPLIAKLAVALGASPVTSPASALVPVQRLASLSSAIVRNDLNNTESNAAKAIESIKRNDQLGTASLARSGS